MSNRWDKKETVTDYFLGLQNHWERWLLPWNENMLAPWKKSHDKHSILKQRFHFANKVCIVKAMVFPIVMYGCELDYKENWMPKNWCFQTMVPEKTFESPLDSKAIKPVNPKGNQPWIFIGRTDAEAEAPILCPSDVTHWKKSWC